MRINNSVKWCKWPRVQCYAAAALVYAGVFALCFILHPILDETYLYHLFFLSSYVAAIFIGGGPSSMIIVLGLVSSNYFFVAPYQQFDHLDVHDALTMGNYIFSSMLVIIGIEYMQRARYQRELLLKVAESRYIMLLRRENQRLILERRIGKLSRCRI
jgi:K+-sensing histidine kinase KdpD